ncbi:hypothetical protein UlMin_007631 [Ulmus minor]
MELTQENPNPKGIRSEEPEHDLYTIPSRSSWFLWDEIHETERVALKEFFDGNSISKTPKIYKEYRDFIINKYREDPNRRLTFTEVRKSLVGDVNLLHKVFLFLEKWGLINFSAPSAAEDSWVVGDEERLKVRIEDSVPNGIRVVAMPNSIKPFVAPPSVKNEGVAVGGGVKFPPLGSYSDVFTDFAKQNKLVCGNCGDHCNSGYYKYTKGDFLICIKCFKDGHYGENKSAYDYKFNECIQDGMNHGTVWTEAETLLLLESIGKYGDDWELVVQNVKTKTKLDCIAKLIEIPLGEVLGFGALTKGNSNNTTGNLNSSEQAHAQLSSSENQENVKTGDQCDEKTNEGEKNGDAMELGPPLKRQRLASLSSPGGSLMEQAALLSTMVGPHITAAAAEAAVTSLCKENSFPREIFDGDDDSVTDGLPTPIADHEPERVVEIEDSEMKEGTSQSENQDTSLKTDDLPLTLRIRAGVATALGAAAAHAKLLADHEEREIEHLVATIIGTQTKKLHCKMKHFEELETIMKKKYEEMEEIEDVLLGERIDVLQRLFKAGIPRWKDHVSIKS